MNGAPAAVTIVEVAARDGLQSDPTLLPTEAKVELIRRAVGAGVRRIETVSFVNPKRVPQMADADAVMAALHADDDLARSGASYIGLVLNERGLQRAIDTGVHEVNAVVVCTDTFARSNQGRTSMELAEAARDVVAGARAAGLRTSVTLTATFGCPFEGEVSADRFAEVTAAVLEEPPDELALADSIGVAAPTDVSARLALTRELIADSGAATGLRCHFHNTRNTGLANAVAAVGAGVTVLDSSLGGIGGCPFAPNATGNVPTEDLVYLLERMGCSTGIDLDALCAVVPWIEERLGHGVPGYLSKAGNFPSRPA